MAKKMKKRRKLLGATTKTKLTAAIATVLLMATTFMLLASIPSTRAQFRGEGAAGGTPGPLAAGVVPDIQVQTWALLSARPTTVGVGQPVLVNLETQPAPGTDRLHQDYTVTITDPDGNEDVRKIESYPDDGTMWFEFIPDQVGEWKIKFDFIGTYFPAGRYLDGVGPPAVNDVTGGTLYTESVYFKPFTTPERTVTVQTDWVASWPEGELPSDYWTRPVPYERREWWPILGGWPWSGPAGSEYGIPLEVFNLYYPDTNPYQPGKDSRGMFAAWTSGPESAHVVWKKELTQAGILGGDWGVEDTNAGVFGGMGIGGDPSTSGYAYIAYAGSAYQLIAKVVDGSPTNVWQRYDVRTGEVIWENTEMTSQVPRYIEYNIGAIPSGGGFPTHVTEVNFVYIGGGQLVKYRASTGLVRTNVSISPLTTGTYYMNGYALSVQDLGATAGADRYRLINWTTLGTSNSLSSRIVSNISWPINSVPSTIDYNEGIAANAVNWQVAGVYYGINVTGIDLKTGAIKWTKTIMDAMYSGSCNVADHGKIAILTLNKGFVCLDLYNGKEVWWSEAMDYPWDAAGFGGYSVQSAYGLLYRQAYSGIYAFDWDDGSIVWKYEAPADYPYETPYINEAGETMYSWNIGANIADGKMYAYNTEHSATVPITRGWKFHCINATTGECIWQVAIPGAASKHTPDIGPIHDGYVQLFSSDGYMYWFGKGKSATTVTAAPKIFALGEKVLIEGTVLDLSPAQPNTPCVSTDSVAAWMEHVHLQRDLPANVTGVPVVLTALDSNGNIQDVGTATTNGYYGTFSFAWEPPIEGDYTIMASFAGDESYGSSSAATAINVGSAPATTPTPPPTEAPIDYTWTIVGMGIAIMIVVVIATVLILRKK
jgi:hypothetical protein